MKPTFTFISTLLLIYYGFSRLHFPRMGKNSRVYVLLQHRIQKLRFCYGMRLLVNTKRLSRDMAKYPTTGFQIEDERLSFPIPKVRPPGQSTEIKAPPDPIFHVVGISSLAFSPDGKTLACAGSNVAIALLDMPTLQVKKSFTGHGAWVNSVAFSPDGRTLVSGSEDGTILIWELER